MTHPSPRWVLNMIDAGARYGIHPTMRGYAVPHRIWAFEPDPNECHYLNEKYQHDDSYMAFPVGLGEKAEPAELRILGHHGLSTTLMPDPDSIWFKYIRPDEGDIETILDITLTDVPSFEREHGFQTDYLKLDIEGTEIAALRGCGNAISHIIAVRTELLFDRSYGRATAPEIIDYLVNHHDFVLVGLDYNGQGSAMNYLCPDDRWGLLIGCEAFFLKSPNALLVGDEESVLQRLFKATVICFENHAHDLGLFLVRALHERSAFGASAMERKETAPYRRSIQHSLLRAIYRLKTMPGDGFERGKIEYESIFGEAFPDRHTFFARLDSL